MGEPRASSAAQLATEIELAMPLWQPFLALGKARADAYLTRIATVDVRFAERGEVHDEQIWTFLATVGYAIAGVAGVNRFTQLIVGDEVPSPNDPRIWLEVLPMSPRLKEGPTNVDIAVGSIEWRPGTTGGVQLADGPESWVCLIEAKWYSDIDTKVSGHPERNQLARVAENAACFQRPGRAVDSATAVLLTPVRFKDSAGTSRFYRYKFNAYRQDSKELMRDWKSLDGVLSPRDQAVWRYPSDIDRRARGLRWGWKTYEELLSSDNLPDSAIKDHLVAFEQRWNGTRLAEGEIG